MGNGQSSSAKKFLVPVEKCDFESYTQQHWRSHRAKELDELGGKKLFCIGAELHIHND